MKKFVEFILVMAALAWAVAGTTPTTEGKIREQLKEEGWTEIQLEQLDGEWSFETKATDEYGRTIVCEGTVVYDDEYGVVPTSMTVYGLEDGELVLLGTWHEGEEDITYTADADRYMYGIEVSCEEADLEE